MLANMTTTMRKIIFLVTVLLIITAEASAQRRSRRSSRSAAQVPAWQSDSVILGWKQHADSLQALIDRYRMADSLATVNGPRLRLNPFFFPLFTQGTLYQQPLRSQMSVQWAPSTLYRQGSLGTIDDSELTSLSAIEGQLAAMYVKHPDLFSQTQETLQKEGAIRQDITPETHSRRKLIDNIERAEIKHDVVDVVAAVTRRPNFWKFSGSGSLQFTQSYFTDNWYQGGDNNYAALSMLTLDVNFDNKQKIQWENRLEGQLGFQTLKDDSEHKLKVTSNLVRYTTKFGYKAAKTWFYTARFQAYTQIYPNYKANSKEFTTRFSSPLFLSLSVGMDFKWKLKRFEGSLYMAPAEVNARYVWDRELRSRYNDNENQAVKWTFGPNVVINYKWTIWKNIYWQARIYYFTDFRYTNIEAENTFTFSINKYLNAKLFVYPKFLDDKKYGEAKAKEQSRYFMMKEFLSLGVSYAW